MAKKAKLPADTNKKAKSVVDLATTEVSETTSDGKNAAAVALGRGIPLCLPFFPFFYCHIDTCLHSK